MNRETVDYPPVRMWPEMACLLEDWAPPQNWRQVEVIPEAVGVALGIVIGLLRDRVPMGQWRLWVGCFSQY